MFSGKIDQMKSLETPVIPNIDMGDSYDSRYADADIHIDTLHNLSEFFGRDMSPHRHDRFYQLHFLSAGEAQVQLGEKRFGGRAPLFYFTPPAIPHAFHLDQHAKGLVLTVRRDLVHRTLAGSENEALEQRFSVPLFQPLNAVGGNLSREAERLPLLMDLLAEEFYEQLPGRRHTLPALVKLILVCVFRLSHLPERNLPLRRIELEIFQGFNELIDRHHREHWSLAQYSGALNVTQSRLGDICRRMSGTSCKSLVHQHQLEEAKWELIYTTAAINVIANELGFADPAYFCRFFTRQCGMSPRQFRQRALKGEL
jgi:AraC family transcriptional regulator, 4-hydroxyphenylacetate 3-monooxygenase operon regulatory protein